jgi:hypothetical protein
VKAFNSRNDIHGISGSLSRHLHLGALVVRAEHAAAPGDQALLIGGALRAALARLMNQVEISISVIIATFAAGILILAWCVLKLLEARFLTPHCLGQSKCP